MPGFSTTEDVWLSPNHTKHRVYKRTPILGTKKFKHSDRFLLPYLVRFQGKTLVVYTDGACSNQGNAQVARAVYGLFYRDGHPWNVSRKLEGIYQTSDRAELMAVVWALETMRDFEGL